MVRTDGFNRDSIYKRRLKDLTMLYTKEWEYVYLTKLCSDHQDQFLSMALAAEPERIRKSAWLRLMGLVETWDMTC